MELQERIIQEFCDLVSVDSVSFQERKLADAVKEKMQELGIRPMEDGADSAYGSSCGNVYGRLEGTSDQAPILLSAHLDTVRPGNGKKAVVDYEKGRITSDGTTVLGADDVAGIVEILEGIRLAKESGKKMRTVELLFPIAEEVYTKGAKVFDYSRIESKEAYCLDLSGDVGIAAYQAPSLISFRVSISGKSAHAGFEPEKGVNAIAALANGIAQVKQGHVDDQSTVNIGVISGGIATNIVSDSACCEGEIRSFSHERALQLVTEIKEIFQAEANRIGGTLDYGYEVFFAAYHVDMESDTIAHFKNACSGIGTMAEFIPTFGGADNHQFHAHGINGIVVACGMENVHTVKEYIKIENLVKGAELVEKLIVD